jgi:hypothetical protein
MCMQSLLKRIKRIISFHIYNNLNEKNYRLRVCLGEYDQQELGKINNLSLHLNPALHSV